MLTGRPGRLPGKQRVDSGRTARVDDGLTLAEAALRLGTSSEAVRKRVKRGSLYGELHDGRWYVYLDRQPDSPGSQRVGARVDGQVDARVAADQTALVQQLRDENSYLRAELTHAYEQLAEERRRSDTILAQLASRLPELPAPQPQPEAPAEPPRRRRWWEFWS
jgi:hypothetical protein